RPRISVTPMGTISMAMSIALVSVQYNCKRPDSSRQHERQPRLGKLQLCGVCRGIHALRGSARRLAPRLEPGGDLLQRTPRRDLRAAPLVDVRTDAVPVRRARFRAGSFQLGETRSIHLLERQLRLEPLL